MNSPIRVFPHSEADAELWRLTREVISLFSGLPWVLIGGQMVAIIEAEHGVVVGRTTVDVDALLDVRTAPAATLEAARILQAAQFVAEHHADGLAYRFVRGTDIVDVLAPDHLGEHAELRTVPPASTLEALGGRQALNRRRIVSVDPGDGAFEVSIPSLVGAIVIKAQSTRSCASLTPCHHRDSEWRLRAGESSRGSGGMPSEAT